MSSLVSPRPVTWQERPVPLSPSAVVGLGAVASALLRRVNQCTADELASLEAVAAPGVFLVLGEEERLPWVNGVSYLGCDPRAPALLLPTTLAPSVHPSLLEQVIRRRLATSQRVAVVLEPPRLISLGGPRPLTVQGLTTLKARVNS
ncbi:MAG: hypothetical protein RMJ98_20015 [Myxococcales bacterium]|nr:hypothetical protein [Polyangiaceae bacterium]MDW8251587.1 hypothetical protein [Myxococcales bacterium]